MTFDANVPPTPTARTAGYRIQTQIMFDAACKQVLVVPMSKAQCEYVKAADI